jgi:hypothetical protein
MSHKKYLAITASAAAIFATLGTPTTANAHFVLQAPTNWVTTNTGDGTPEKTAPCGNEVARLVGGGVSGPSRVVNQLVANADGTTTVTITVDEVVPHAGWYRVAVVSGASSTQNVIALPEPTTPANSCAATIVNPPVLPVVADGILMHQQAFSGPQTVQVTIPNNVTCTNAAPCTLQVVEVMNDGGHFPPGCFYHHCADIAIDTGDSGASTATDSGATTTNGTGDGSAVATTPPTSDDGGGCAVAASGHGRVAIPALGVLLALAALARRRAS